MRTCQGKISLTSVLPEEMRAQFRADIPEGGSTERGAGRTERDKTTVAICDTGPNDKVEDKTTLNRGTGERAKICAG